MEDGFVRPQFTSEMERSTDYSQQHTTWEDCCGWRPNAISCISNRNSFVLQLFFRPTSQLLAENLRVVPNINGETGV